MTASRRRAGMLVFLLSFTAAVASASAAAAQAPGNVISSVVFAQRPDGPLLLDAYLPQGQGPFPGVVLIHGGAWKSGSRQDDAKMAMLLASDGFVAFAVDYRLLAPYPAALHDVEDAVRFVRQRASEYSLDPARLGAMGFSAGGELAGLLGTLGHGSLTTGTRVGAVATWSGPMDLEALLESGDPRIVPLVTGYLGCEPSPTCDSVAHEASPINHVDVTDAPIYLANSSDEIMPVDQASGMERALKSDDVTTELTLVPGAEHVPLTDATIAGAVAFFSKALGGPTSAPGQSGEGRPTPTLGPGKVGPAERASQSASAPSSTVIAAGVAIVVGAVAGVVGYSLWNRRRFRYLSGR